MFERKYFMLYTKEKRNIYFFDIYSLIVKTYKKRLYNTNRLLKIQNNHITHLIVIIIFMNYLATR